MASFYTEIYIYLITLSLSIMPWWAAAPQPMPINETHTDGWRENSRVFEHRIDHLT